MLSQPADMALEVVRAESSRYRHPLLLLHGLWTGGWIWRDVGAYFAHRGWDVWIPSFLGAGRSAMSLQERTAALLALGARLPAPPIPIVHDVGLVIADSLAREMSLPALIAIAPVRPGAGLLSGVRSWRARLGAARIPPPRSLRARALLAGLGAEDVARLERDAGSVVRAAASSAPLRAARFPGLVVSPAHDAAAPELPARAFARERGWDFELCQTSGHFPMLGSAATGLADALHRWTVRALGERLLAWVDDEDDGK